ncbi:MAG TPA: hypothetical protein VJ818_01560 [Actinomycetota bacterium]|nr:hypothetical protein [Actinomycetota bacterium]
MPRFYPGPVRGVDWGFTVVHLIFWALVVAAIVWLIVWLVRTPHHAFHEHHMGPSPQHADTALQEARMRYARGEMTREEFLQISTDLGGPMIAPPTQEPGAPSEPKKS